MRLRADRAREECPFVVAITTLISPHGRLLASTHHSHDAPSPVRDSWWGGPSVERTSRRNVNIEQLKVVVRDGVEISTAQESLMEENIKRGRKRPAILPLEEDNRPYILLTSKHQLRFSFAADGRTPHGKSHANHEAHGTHAHEQRRHRIAAPARAAKALTLRRDSCSLHTRLFQSLSREPECNVCTPKGFCAKRSC